MSTSRLLRVRSSCEAGPASEPSFPSGAPPVPSTRKVLLHSGSVAGRRTSASDSRLDEGKGRVLPSVRGSIWFGSSLSPSNLLPRPYPPRLPVQVFTKTVLREDLPDLLSLDLESPTRLTRGGDAGGRARGRPDVPKGGIPWSDGLGGRPGIVESRRTRVLGFLIHWSSDRDPFDTLGRRPFCWTDNEGAKVDGSVWTGREERSSLGLGERKTL